MGQLEKPSEEELKRNKVEKLNKSMLKSLAQGISQKYPVTMIVDDYSSYFFHHGMSVHPDMVKFKVGNYLCDRFLLTSYRFLKEPELLDFVLRTLTSDDCSSDDYYKLAILFIVRKDIQALDDFTIERLLEILSQKDAKKAELANFCRQFKNSYDWENVYNQYNKMLTEGFVPEDFSLMPNIIQRAIKTFSRINQNDQEAMWLYVKVAQSNFRDGMIKTLKYLALLGDQEAMRQLSDALFSKVVALYKQREDLYWHEMAANNGYANAIFRAGRIYLGNILDHPLDEAKAKHYLKLAAKQGFTEATTLLERLKAPHPPIVGSQS